MQYFAATNNAVGSPQADPDGDGHNNYQEFLAGTNPTNGAAVLKIVGMAQEGNNVHLTWTMGSGRTNALQFSAGPFGVYSDLFTISNTVGTITDYVHIGAVTSAPAGFYRVRLLP